MAHISITVDDEVVMDADPGQWTHTPPDLSTLTELGGGKTPQPWLQTIMFVIAKRATAALATAAGTPALPVTDTTWTMAVRETEHATTITVTTH